MENLNVAFLHFSCPPVVGGVEEIVRQQSLLLHQYQQQVKIFAGNGKQFTDKHPVEINPLLGSQNEQILAAHQLVLKHDLTKMYDLAREIYQYLRDALRKFHILIAHNVMTMHYNLPLTYALHWFAGDGHLPVVSWNHDSPYFYSEYPVYLDQPPWNILKQTHPEIYYVAISKARKKKFSELYGNKKPLQVIPNGIDPLNFFRIHPDIMSLIRNEKLLEGEMILVQPARLHPRKNVELSIRITHAINDLGIDARLLVTGAYDPHEIKTVEYHDKLKELVRELGMENKVFILTGYTTKSGKQIVIDNDSISDLYAIADCVLLPSLEEGFGLTLLESGIIKLPVVCSNIPAFVEIGGDDVCIFDLGDSPKAIARKTLDFLHTLKPHRMFHKVMHQYAWDKILHSEILPFFNLVTNEYYGNRNCVNSPMISEKYPSRLSDNPTIPSDT